MEALGAMDPMQIPLDEELNWADFDYDGYDGYHPFIYDGMGYFEAMYTFIFWETWISMKQLGSKKLLYPTFLYILSVACIAIALNVKERFRAAWVTASIAIGTVIIKYIYDTDFIYITTDTFLRLVIIHNMGAVVMILWEKFCLTEEQKRLPWGRRAIATYKIMWNSRFVNTARPAPVYHLLKADEGFQNAALRAAATGKDKAEKRDSNTTIIEQPGNPRVFPRIKNTWNVARQLGSRAWGCLRQPVARFWNWFSPRNRWIMRTIAIIITVWVADRIKDHVVQTLLVFEWTDVEKHKASFFRRINQVTRREMVIRSYFAFEAIWGAYAFYTRVHSAIAVFFVAVRVDEPEEWPPVFGDIRQAWNLRRFWSKYWDRLIYRAVNGLGEMFMTGIGLGQRPFRGKKRWLLNGLVFAISGIFHGVTDYFCGIHCGYLWELWWWNMNFVAIVGETALLYGIQTYFPRFYYRMSGKAGKAIGFFWVFSWLFWASPKNQFVAMHCMPMNR